MDAIDIRPYVVPFVWPLVKYVRDRYYDSSKAVSSAYEQSAKSCFQGLQEILRRGVGRNGRRQGH